MECPLSLMDEYPDIIRLYLLGQQRYPDNTHSYSPSLRLYPDTIYS